MKFFLDTEFWDRGPDYPLQVVSLALVAENGTSLYLANADFDWNSGELAADVSGQWLLANVRPNIHAASFLLLSRDEFPGIISDFVGRLLREGEPAEFYGWYSAYDWVVLCQLFGGMVNLPKAFAQFCYDLRMVVEMVGLENLPPQQDVLCPLLDALWIRQLWRTLTTDALVSD